MKALVIDDERAARIAIIKLGHWARYGIDEVMEASDGEEGLRVLYETKPELIFVDMKMPTINGISFLERAQQDFPQPKHQYIVESGYDDFRYAQAAMKNGASDYLLKPIVPDELSAAIERAMRRISPAIEFSGTAPDSASTPTQVVEIIREYIDTKYTESIRVSDFADRYYFSREYLMKLFKQKYGTGIYDYLQSVRLERAKELLGNPSIPIRSVAQRVGYTEDNYFSKAFRKLTGVSPSRYRQNLSKK